LADEELMIGMACTQASKKSMTGWLLYIILLIAMRSTGCHDVKGNAVFGRTG